MHDRQAVVSGLLLPTRYAGNSDQSPMFDETNDGVAGSSKQILLQLTTTKKVSVAVVVVVVEFVEIGGLGKLALL